MKLPDSTEWVLHSVAALAQLDPGTSASAAKLARYYDVPPTYLAKQLQLLVRAGILAATTGPRGGFRLARTPDRITLLDLVEAVDGTSPPYVCQELRQRGVGAAPPQECEQMCGLAEKMADAHEAWRASLAATTVAEIVASLPAGIPDRTRSRMAQA